MGIYTKRSWERKRENDKLENTDTAEKLLQINRELKLKRQKETLEAEKKRKKGEVLDNRRWTVKQHRKNKPWSPTSLKQQDNEQKELNNKEQAPTAGTADCSSLIRKALQ